MKIHLLKIILFSMLGSSIVFAGGVEEDSGPETISETEQQVPDESTDYDARAKEVKKVTLERNQFFRAGGGVLWFGDKKSALNHMANLPSKKEYYSK